MTWEVTDRRYNTIIDGVGADPLNSTVVVSDQENAVYSCESLLQPPMCAPEQIAAPASADPAHSSHSVGLPTKVMEGKRKKDIYRP